MSLPLNKHMSSRLPVSEHAGTGFFFLLFWGFFFFLSFFFKRRTMWGKYAKYVCERKKKGIFHELFLRDGEESET